MEAWLLAEPVGGLEESPEAIVMVLGFAPEEVEIP